MKQIFVFGSNLAGIHGAGAAKEAMRLHGAEFGIGVGRTGNSYGIPTKDKNILTMPLNAIETYVKAFCDYAQKHDKESFFVTRLGCGLAGYSDSDIAPLFKNAPSNCILPIEWKPYLDDDVATRVTFHRWEDQAAEARRR